MMNGAHCSIITVVEPNQCNIKEMELEVEVVELPGEITKGNPESNSETECR
jgi:hypothetical protein